MVQSPSPQNELLARLEAQAGDRSCSCFYRQGSTLREILQITDCRPFAACAGNGACGMCRVRVLEGLPSAPTDAEQITLPESLLKTGVRLACQTRMFGDARVEILNPCALSDWRTPDAGATCPGWKIPLGTPSGKLGLAVDVGTTHINLSVVDLGSGVRCGARAGLNRQIAVGTDVMARLLYAASSAGHHKKVVRMVRETIHEGIGDLFLGEGLNQAAVEAVSIVGNTAMLLLLLGDEPRHLLDPQSWDRRLDLPAVPEGELAELWNLPQVRSWIVPQPLWGFVGSDVLAGLVATRIVAQPDATVAFVDFGTNSEIALWHQGRLYLASAAGGPAFEGTGLSCGAPARKGAIHRVWKKESGGFGWESLLHARPTGICGSGLLDTLAVLRHEHLLSERGYFVPDRGVASLQLFSDVPYLQLSKRDVDLLQRAKAAVAAGLDCLLQKANVAPETIEEFFIAGAFGKSLNLVSATQVGLVPDLPIERFRLCGNTALAGAECLLLFPEARADCGRFVQVCHGMNLAAAPEFEDCFFQHLPLCRWRVRPPAPESPAHE